jgi:hypothetical protein
MNGVPTMNATQGGGVAKTTHRAAQDFHPAYTPARPRASHGRLLSGRQHARGILRISNPGVQETFRRTGRTAGRESTSGIFQPAFAAPDRLSSASRQDGPSLVLLCLLASVASGLADMKATDEALVRQQERSGELRFSPRIKTNRGTSKCKELTWLVRQQKP